MTKADAKSDELAVKKVRFFISFQPITWRAAARRVLTGAVTVHYFIKTTLHKNVNEKEEVKKKKKRQTDKMPLE